MPIGSGGIVEIYIPPGGTVGQVLGKTDVPDYAINWVDPTGGGGGTGADGFNRISAGTQLAGTLNTIKFADSNGISFGMSGSTQITASYTVPSVVGLISAINVSAGTTSNNVSAFQFADGNGISFGLNGSTITATVGTNYLTSQSNQAFSASGGSSAFQTLNFANSNGFTFSNSNGSVIGSYTVPNVPAQTNQTVGLYALGNTTQNSSTTLDARTISFNGLGAATVGFSNGSVQFSVPVQTNQSAIKGLGASNTGNTAGNTGLSTGVDWVLAGSNNITISQSTVGGGPNTLWVSGANAGGGGIGIQVSDTTYTNGTVTLQNANGITFGSSGAGGVSASYTVPSTAGLISAVNVSAGTTSNNLSAMTFSNLNGVTFGLNGSVVTASVAAVGGAQTGISGIANSETTYTSGTVSYSALGALTIRSTTGQQFQFSVNSQTNQSGGVYALGNTTGQSSSSTFDARTFSINGGGAVSVGWSNSSLLISAPNTIAQTNQTVGLYALGNTTQNSSTTMDARTLSFNALGAATMGYSNGSIQVSVPTQTAQTVGLYASSQTTGQSSSSTVDARSISLVGAGNISVGLSAGSFIISQTGGGGGAGISAGTQSVNTGTVVFSNSNNVSFGMSGSSRVTASAAVNLYGLGNTTQNSSTVLDIQSISLNGLGMITVGYSNGSVQLSATQSVQTQASGAIAGSGFTSGGANVGISGTNNSAGLSLSITAAAQTAQTMGLYASSQTTGSASSGTLDARSLSIIGAGIVSIGMNSTSAGGTTTGLVISATQSNQAFSAAGGSSAFQTLGFSDNSNASWTNTNGSVGIASIRASLFAVSNTTQSSSGTQNINAISFAGAGIASVGVSNGSVVVSVPSGGGGGDGYNIVQAGTTGTTGTTFSSLSGTVFLNGSGALTVSQNNSNQIVLSAPQTSSLVGTNGISISTNGSTISIGQNYMSFYEPKVRGGTTTQSLANGTVYFQPFHIDEPVAAYHLRYLQSVSSQSATTMSFSASVSAGNASSGTGRFNASGTMLLFSRQATGTNANSSNIISFASATYSYGIGYSNSVSWSTNASSATASWTTSAAISFISQIDSTGGITTGSTGTSGSSTFSSTSTNANSFSSSYIMSMATGSFAGSVRPVFVPLTANLVPGEYWLGHIMSTNTASTNYSMQRVAMLSSIGAVVYTSVTQGHMEFGNTTTVANSNFMAGWGSYSASSQTTTTIPLSQISGMSQFQTYFGLFGATK